MTYTRRNFPLRLAGTHATPALTRVFNQLCKWFADYRRILPSPCVARTRAIQLPSFPFPLWQDHPSWNHTFCLVYTRSVRVPPPPPPQRACSSSVATSPMPSASFRFPRCWPNCLAGSRGLFIKTFELTRFRTRSFPTFWSAVHLFSPGSLVSLLVSPFFFSLFYHWKFPWRSAEHNAPFP